MRGVAGLDIREDSVEDLVLTETQEGGQFRVGGVCLGKDNNDIVCVGQLSRKFIALLIRSFSSSLWG